MIVAQMISAMIGMRRIRLRMRRRFRVNSFTFSGIPVSFIVCLLYPAAYVMPSDVCIKHRMSLCRNYITA
jgi:hypothetical protein